MPAARALDRTSVVPLYYQLQEILKEQIESGTWSPGSALPPETKLASIFGISRICVRQALQILEDDREIVRIQGRGTFVAPRKLAYRPTGITGLQAEPQKSGTAIRVLDTKVGVAERLILSTLEAQATDVGRLTALWLRDDEPFAIGQHFFRTDSIPFAHATAGKGLDLESLPESSFSVSITVESTQCGRFEADLLGIPDRSTFLLTLGTVRSTSTTAAVEVFRLGLRGDIVQLMLDAHSPANPGSRSR